MPLSKSRKNRRAILTTRLRRTPRPPLAPRLRPPWRISGYASGVFFVSLVHTFLKLFSASKQITIKKNTRCLKTYSKISFSRKEIPQLKIKKSLLEHSTKMAIAYLSDFSCKYFIFYKKREYRQCLCSPKKSVYDLTFVI